MLNVIKPPSEIIYSEILMCSNCLYYSKFLIQRDKRYELYDCAFVCRAYYCNNRNCVDMFGYTFQVMNLKNLTCDECKMELARHWKGLDTAKCNRNSFDQFMHTRCVQNGKISIHCCSNCYNNENDIYDNWSSVNNDNEYY